MMLVFVVLVGFTSLAVDGGRYYLIKTRLQMAADAAARYGASGLVQYEYDEDGTLQGHQIDQAAAQAHVEASLQNNPVDGKNLSVDSSEVEFYGYDTAQQALTDAIAPDGPYAIRVRLHDSIDLIFGGVIGLSRIDATAVSTAVVQPKINITSKPIMAYWNPWLAGMEGTGAIANPNNPHKNPDYEGEHTYYPTQYQPDTRNINVTPSSMDNLPLNAGTALEFHSVVGTSTNDPDQALFNPDGDVGTIVGNGQWGSAGSGHAEFGKSNVQAPINSVVGVFLGPDSPEGRTPPSDLYFDTSEKRNFSVLKPELRQVFFIGDGKTDQDESQKFIIPEGATRLYIGNMDGYEWNNNHGERTTTVIRPEKIFLVKNNQALATTPDDGDTGDTGGNDGGGSADSGNTGGGGGYSDGGSDTGGQNGGDDQNGNTGGGNNGGSGGGRNGNGNNGGGGGRNGNGNNGGGGGRNGNGNNGGGGGGGRGR